GWLSHLVSHGAATHVEKRLSMLVVGLTVADPGTFFQRLLVFALGERFTRVVPPPSELLVLCLLAVGSSTALLACAATCTSTFEGNKKPNLCSGFELDVR